MLTSEFAASFGRLTANHLWQSTAFAAVAVLLALALRANHARARYWLWLAASVKFLVPFSALAAIGAALGRWLIPAPPASPFPFVMEQIVQPFTPMPYPSLPAPPSALPAASLLPALLLSLWLCGFLAVLLYAWTRWRRVAAAVRSATPLTEGRELEALSRIQAQWGRLAARQPARRLPTAARADWQSARRMASGPTTPRLVSSTAQLEPGVFGIFRPILWLPAGIAHRLEDAELEAILAHELCHIRRRDNLLATLHLLVESIFWFHPLVWWLGARLEEERERACDEEVVRLGGEPQIYAESILKVCEFYLASPVACAAGVTGGDLKKRIEGIMSNRLIRELGFGKRVLLTLLAAVAVGAPIVVGVLHPPRLRAQPGPAFEAASVQIAGPESSQDRKGGGPVKFDAAVIKLDQIGPGPQGLQGGPGTGSPGRITWGKVWLRVLIAKAFRVNSENVSGPGWMSGPSFIGGGGGQMYLLLATMPPETSEHDFEAMLQNFLIEQFRIKLHHEPRNFPAYDLVVMPGGAKLKAAANPDGPDIAFMGAVKKDSDGFLVLPPGHGVLFTMNDGNHGRYQSFTMSEFAESIGTWVTPPGGTRHYVRDKTGLTGKYDFTLAFDQAGAGGDVTVGPGVLAEGGRPPEPEVTGLPNFSRAIEKQLGLRLVKAPDIPMDTLVIDHAERIPLGN
jgi:uncharacterized protein (TIGR03435 family)